MHSSITLDRVMQVVEEQNAGGAYLGICTECGEEKDDVEPDAEGYPCDDCGESTVVGAEHLLVMMA